MTTTEIVDVLGRTSRVADVVGRTRRVSNVRGRTDRVSDVLGETGLELGGGDPGFDASTYGTLISWVSASQGTYTGGASVATLADESGNGNSYAASTGSREATFLAGPPKRFSFDGDDYYSGASRTPYNRLHQTTAQGGGGGTVALLYKWADADGSAIAALWGTRGTNPGNLGVVICVDNRSGDALRVAVGNGSLPTDAVTITTGWHSAIVACDPDAGQYRIYHDGTLLNTRAFTPSASASQVAPVVGAEPQFPNLFELLGDLAEVAVYSDVLSAGTVSSLHTAMMGTVS